MDLIVSKYIWPKITGEPFCWPKELNILTMSTWETIQDLIDNWFSPVNIPAPAKLSNLKALAGKFVPILAKISDAFALFRQERCAAGYLAGLDIEDKEYRKMILKDVPRQFTVFPIPSMKWRHVNINTQALCHLAGISRGETSYENNMGNFNQCFKLDDYGYNRYGKRSCPGALGC